LIFAAVPFVGRALEAKIFPEKAAALYPFSYLKMGWKVIGRGVLLTVVRSVLDLLIS